VNNRTKDIDRLCEIAVKDLFRSEADVIIPYFLKGVTVEGPLSAEERSIGGDKAEERTMSWIEECEKAWVMSWAEGWFEGWTAGQVESTLKMLHHRFSDENLVERIKRFFGNIPETAPDNWARIQVAGWVEGKIEGKIETITKLLRHDFSEALVEFAEQILGDIEDIESLRAFEHVALTSDEQGVRAWLEAHPPTGHRNREASQFLLEIVHHVRKGNVV